MASTRLVVMSISNSGAISRTELVDAFDGNAAQGQGLGELTVGQGEAGYVGTNPLGENVHLLELLQKAHIAGVELAYFADTVLHHGNAFYAHAEGEAADFFAS